MPVSTEVAVRRTEQIRRVFAKTISEVRRGSTMSVRHRLPGRLNAAGGGWSPPLLGRVASVRSAPQYGRWFIGFYSPFDGKYRVVQAPMNRESLGTFVSSRRSIDETHRILRVRFCDPDDDKLRAQSRTKLQSEAMDIEVDEEIIAHTVGAWLSIGEMERAVGASRRVVDRALDRLVGDDILYARPRAVVGRGRPSTEYTVKRTAAVVNRYINDRKEKHENR